MILTPWRTLESNGGKICKPDNLFTGPMFNGAGWPKEVTFDMDKDVCCQPHFHMIPEPTWYKEKRVLASCPLTTTLGQGHVCMPSHKSMRTVLFLTERGMGSQALLDSQYSSKKQRIMACSYNPAVGDRVETSGPLGFISQPVYLL